MGPRYTRVLAVIGAAAILVVGANAVSYAATGKSLILGKTNKANKVTTVQRTTSGPALNLKTKKSSNPPFTTNGKGRVANLNADKVDGYEAATLIGKSNAALAAGNDVKSIRYQDTAPSRAANTLYAIGSVPAGTYIVTMNASIVPTTRGTQDLPNTDSCYLRLPGILSPDVLAQSTVVDTGAAYVGVGFSNVLTFTGSETLQLFCTTSTNDGWSYSNGLFSSFGEPPTISFTRIDGVTNKTLAP